MSKETETVAQEPSPSSMTEIRQSLEQVVDRWCPKINPAQKDSKPEPFETRMSRALLNLVAFEIDYRRVIAGGKALRTDYPLPLPKSERA